MSLHSTRLRSKAWISLLYEITHFYSRIMNTWMRASAMCQFNIKHLLFGIIRLKPNFQNIFKKEDWYMYLKAIFLIYSWDTLGYLRSSRVTQNLKNKIKSILLGKKKHINRSNNTQAWRGCNLFKEHNSPTRLILTADSAHNISPLQAATQSLADIYGDLSWVLEIHWAGTHSAALQELTV